MNSLPSASSVSAAHNSPPSLSFLVYSTFHQLDNTFPHGLSLLGTDRLEEVADLIGNILHKYCSHIRNIIDIRNIYNHSHPSHFLRSHERGGPWCPRMNVLPILAAVLETAGLFALGLKAVANLPFSEAFRLSRSLVVLGCIVPLVGCQSARPGGALR
jgi:hypothetical protein